MLSFVDHMTAKNILAEHAMRMAMAQEETPRTRDTVAILFRSLLQTFGFANEFSPDEENVLKAAAVTLSDNMPFRITRGMATEAMHMSKRTKSSVIGASSAHGFRFMGGLLLVWSRTDDSEKRLRRLVAGKPNKRDRLFRSYYEALSDLFSGHEQLLFTDQLDRQTQNLGLL